MGPLAGHWLHDTSLADCLPRLPCRSRFGAGSDYANCRRLEDTYLQLLTPPCLVFMIIVLNPLSDSELSAIFVSRFRPRLSSIQPTKECAMKMNWKKDLTQAVTLIIIFTTVEILLQKGPYSVLEILWSTSLTVIVAFFILFTVRSINWSKSKHKQNENK